MAPAARRNVQCILEWMRSLPRHAPYSLFFWAVQLSYRIRGSRPITLLDIALPVLLFLPWRIRPRTWRLVVSTGAYFVIYYVAFLPLLDDIVTRADWGTIPRMEQALFGGWNPVEAVQGYRTVPLNVFFCVGYSLHIMNILFPLFYLMFRRRLDHAEEFVSAFLACGLLGFAVYLLFPVVPPRLALPFVHSVVPPWASDTWESAGEIFRANPYAAMPSLHCAFPFLSFLFLRSRGYSIAWMFLFMSFWLFFGTVYLGEHYVLDVLGGIMVAVLGWIGTGTLSRSTHVCAPQSR